MKNYRTQQEAFWAGDFGTEYIQRNQAADDVASNLVLFSKILEKREKIDSVIEFGSNIGLNLMALNLLLPGLKDISAIEINQEAIKILRENTFVKNIYEGSIFDFQTDYQRDFVLIKGVMIHLNPDMLDQTYEVLYKTSKKYICITEYYNPTPMAISYRGHEERLFKRDFAGEMMNKYPDLKLIDYGFSYRRDENFLQNDDSTWFLLKK